MRQLIRRIFYRKVIASLTISWHKAGYVRIVVGDQATRWFSGNGHHEEELWWPRWKRIPLGRIESSETADLTID